MATEVSTAKLSLDISDFKQNIQEAKRQIALANAEFKSASAGLDKWADSAEGVSAKIKQLKTNLDAQERILESYRQQLEKVVAEEGESSKGADDLRIKIYNQEAVVKSTEKELEKYNNRLEELEDVTDDAEDATDDLGESMEDLDPEGQADGFTVLKGAIADLVANGIRLAISAIKDFAKEVVQTGREFDSSMSKVGALSGASAEELQMLRDTAKEFGASTIFSASESADALGYMALAGWDAQQSADALGGVLNLAAASGMDLAEASDLCTDYMSAFGWEASQAADFADILAYAQANANTTVEGLGDAFRNVSANMAAAGQDVETTTSLLSMMANQGLKGAKAGTALAAVLRDMTAKMGAADFNLKSFSEALIKTGKGSDVLIDGLSKVGITNKELNEAIEESKGDIDALMTSLTKSAKEGTDVEKVFNDLGFTMEDLGAVFAEIEKAQKDYTIDIGETEIAVTDSNGKFRDMTDILLDVEKATAGMEDAEKAVALSSTFTADSIKGLNLLLNAGVESAAEFEEELRGSGGAAEEMSKVMNDNLGGDMTALKSKFEGVQIALYEKLEPALRKGVEALSRLLDVFDWLVEHGDGVVAVLGGVATALGTFLAIFKAQSIISGFVSALSAVKTAIIAVNAALLANPIGLIIGLIAALVAAFIYFWNTSEDFRNFFIGMWEGIKETVGNVVDAIAGFFKDAWEFITDLFSDAGKFFSEVWEGIKGIFSVVAGFFKETVVDPIIDFFRPVITFYTEAWKIIKELAEGAWKLIQICWSKVSGWFDEKVIAPIKKRFTEFWDGVKERASKTWEGIKNVWTVVKTWFDEKVITPVTDFFSNMWDGLKTKASEAWEGIKNAFAPVADWFREKFSKAWEEVRNVFSTGGTIFEGITDGITNAFKTVVNAIIRGINNVIAMPFDAINNMLDKIAGVSIAGIKPFEKLVSRFTVPQIPELARGGVLEKGQTGFLEGNGAEAVVPLENNSKWIAATARALRSSLGEEGLTSGGVTNNYNFVQNNTSPKALSRLEIYRQTQNQLAFARGV